MTPEQQAHALSLATAAYRDVLKKYRAGQKEHGGNLWEKFTALDLAKEALAEAIDQVIYLHTLVDMLEEARAVVAAAPYV